MKVEKLSHSALILSGAEGSVMVDPGGFTPQAADRIGGVSAVVLTHAHPDHLNVELVAGSGLPVWGPQQALDKLAEGGADCSLLRAVAAGDAFEVTGLRFEAFGHRHATVHPDIPLLDNVGYLVGGRLLVTGDAWVELGGREPEVELLALPASAPWMRIREAIDYARKFPQARCFPVHDAILSKQGFGLVDKVLTGQLGDCYVRPEGPLEV